EHADSVGPGCERPHSALVEDLDESGRCESSGEARVLAPILDVRLSRGAHEPVSTEIGREDLFVARDLIKVHKQPAGRVVHEWAGHLELRIVHGYGITDGRPGHGYLRVAVCDQHSPRVAGGDRRSAATSSLRTG